MGNSVQYEFINTEKTKWNNHSLQIESERAILYKQKIDQMGPKIHRCRKERVYKGFKYFHYFLTDGIYVLEFEGEDIYSSQVSVSTRLVYDYELLNIIEFNDLRRERAKKLVGTLNYSLLLRNCEHVVSYIVGGVWESSQTVKEGVILDFLRTYFIGTVAKKINTLPLDLINKFTPDTKTPLNESINRIFNYEKKAHSIAVREQDFNIVILGPTGSGKSYLINLLYNRSVVESRVCLESVSKCIEFTQGSGAIRGVQKRINLVDTIGLCDTVLSYDQLYRLITNAVRSNIAFVDKVIFLLPPRFANGMKESIKQLLRWLKYEQHCTSFLFLINQTGTVSERDKEGLCDALGRILNVNGPIGDKNMVFAVDTIMDPKGCLDTISRFLNDKSSRICVKKDSKWCTIL